MNVRVIETAGDVILNLRMLFQFNAALAIATLLVAYLFVRLFPQIQRLLLKTAADWLLRSRVFPALKKHVWLSEWLHSFSEPNQALFVANTVAANAQRYTKTKRKTRHFDKAVRKFKFPERPTVIDSPWRTYTDFERLACNTIYSTYQTAGDYPNRFVVRIAHNDRGDWALRKESRLIERIRAHSHGSTYKKYLPREFESFQYQGRKVLVFQFNAQQCFTASQIRRRFPQGLDGRHVAWMFNRMLESLGFFHRSGSVHTAMMPQHLLFNVDNHGLTVVDWTHARRIGEGFGVGLHRYKRWLPQEVASFRAALPQTDIFMAAKCASYLAGGDPRTNLVPQHLPPAMRRFLKACLLESPRMRPDDAWELHEQFRDLLEDIYGSPSFHDLEMKGK